MSDERWEIYEKIAQEAVRAFSDLLGISVVEGKQRLLGKSGTSWVVDAKAERLGGGFFVLEFKSGISSGLSQIEMAGIAFAIKDTDANGGILVSVLQAITQINEATLTFIPKMVAIIVVLVVMAPWMLEVLSEYTTTVLGNAGEWVR